MKKTSIGLLMMTSFALCAQAFAEDPPLPEKFAVRPTFAHALFNAAGAQLGRLPNRAGLPNIYSYYLGTDPASGRGMLVLDFSRPFQDGQGADFALVTSAEGWGALASRASVQFFLGQQPKGTILVNLEPGDVFRFEMPHVTGIADRVIITNLSGPPSGTDIAIVDAGAAYEVPIRNGAN